MVSLSESQGSTIRQLASQRDAKITPTGVAAHDVLVRSLKGNRLKQDRLGVPYPAVRTPVVYRPSLGHVGVEPALGVELSVALRLQLPQLLLKLRYLGGGVQQSRLRSGRQLRGDPLKLNLNLVHLVLRHNRTQLSSIPIAKRPKRKLAKPVAHITVAIAHLS